MLCIRKGTDLFFMMSFLSPFLLLGMQALNFLVDLTFVRVRNSSSLSFHIWVKVQIWTDSFGAESGRCQNDNKFSFFEQD